MLIICVDRTFDGEVFHAEFKSVFGFETRICSIEKRPGYKLNAKNDIFRLETTFTSR